MRIAGCLGLVAAVLVGCAGSAENAAESNADVTGDKILLDCNVFESGGGPDQQATVVQRGEKLFLKELTNTGSMQERELSKEEWESRDLKLRLDRWDLPDTVNRLWKEDGDWMNESKSDGWHTLGSAYCFKDTTKKD